MTLKQWIENAFLDTGTRNKSVIKNMYEEACEEFDTKLNVESYNRAVRKVYNELFNKKVSVGKPVVKKGAEAHAHQLIHLLSTQPRFIDPNVEIAFNQIRLLLSEKSWAVHSIDEKPYKVYVVAEHPCGKVKLELNVPATGNVSSINLVKADTKAVADVFKTEFSNV